MMYKPVVFQFAAGLAAGAVLCLLFSFFTDKETPDAMIRCDQLNRMIVGIGNDQRVFTRGIPPGQLRINTDDGLTFKQESGDVYTFSATQPGIKKVTITDGNAFSKVFEYKVIPMPDPELLLGARHKSKVIGNGEFKAQGGLAAVITCCGFDAKCEVVSYWVSRTGGKNKVEKLKNEGARYQPLVQTLVDQATPGNIYYFDEAMVRCPGDKHARNLGSLVFHIK